MKINSKTRITGDKIILIPYKHHHVPKYNQWMSSKEIQELTASEPLSLDEEYEMCSSWENDEDKLTFIILNRDIYETSNLLDRREREVSAMIGDVNIFIINEPIDDDDDADYKHAELEIMIADKSNRGCGRGIEAVYLIMNYCYQKLAAKLDLKSFIAKITDTNEASIRMFEKIGFKQYKHIKAFNQVSLRLEINEKSFTKDFNNKLDKNLELNINEDYE